MFGYFSPPNSNGHGTPLLQWIHKSACKHTSPENQNEMLELMAHHVLRKILANIHSSPFIAVMVDEATDKANKEQLTIVVRWISEDFVVSEEFLGLYCLSAIDAQSIVEAMKDAFLRFQIPLAEIRGQCYDECSTMAGVKAGVATKSEQVEPRAVFTHCYGHALNLAVTDTFRFSPKREAMLREVKEEIGSDAPAVQTLCPTRWTVRAESLASILANYDNIQVLWVTSLHKTSDTEMKARIQGVASQMQLFRFFLCLILSEMILRHTDRLVKRCNNPSFQVLKAMN